MNRGEIFRFIAEEISASGGTYLSLNDFYALTAIEEMLSTFDGNSIDALAIASIAVLSPNSDQAIVAKKFGVKVSDAFKDFAFQPGAWRASIARAVRYILDKNTAELIARSAIAVLAAEVERVIRIRDQQKIKELSGLIESVIKTANEEYKNRSQSLLVKLCVKDLAPSSEKRPPIWLIALSIDVAASTEAKTRMKKLAASDDQLTELYTQFYKNFLFNEDRFYRSIFSETSSSGTAKFDWRRLFVVKGIGDEIWLLYEIPQDDKVELNGAMARLVEAAFSLVESTLPWSGGEHIEEPYDDLNMELDQHHDRMDLPFKCFADLVTDGLEISEIRAEFFERKINDYTGKKHSFPKEADYANLGNRLNVGTFDLSGRTRRVSRRSDFIGHEIDRFFRATKAALPGVFTVGESLFNKMAVTSKAVGFHGLFKGNLTYSNSIANIDHNLSFIYGRRELTKCDMKGIGHSYSAYCLVTLPILRGLHSWCDSGSRHVISPTIDLFPKESLGNLD